MSLDKIDITTPEHVALKFKLGGIGSRATAQIIDWFILGIINMAIVFSLILLQEQALFVLASDYLSAFIIILMFVLWWGYFTLTEFFMAGRTPGKMIMGLRVIQDNGQSITFLSAIIRNLLRIVDFVPMFYLVGILMIFFHSKHKRIGDLAAGTIVIYERKLRKKKKRNPLEKEMEKRNIDPHRITLDEWSKKKIGARDWTLLKTYMERRHSLVSTEREEMTMKVGAILLPMIGGSPDKSVEEIEKDLIALYVLLQEEWDYEIH